MLPLQGVSSGAGESLGIEGHTEAKVPPLLWVWELCLLEQCAASVLYLTFAKPLHVILACFMYALFISLKLMYLTTLLSSRAFLR